MKRILITGATGQIGTELTPALRQRYGTEQVVAVGHKKEPAAQVRSGGPYVNCDVRDKIALAELVRHYKIDTIYHLAALLSATGEKEPQLAWDVNITGLFNVLEVARLHGCAVFHPSSIGAFGPDTPHDHTPQVTIQRPDTMYGVSKVTGELLCDYYFRRYGVDTRGVRYPGLISHTALPGGGTTDYAVEIFYAALGDQQYTCYLEPTTRLDMMYMPDAIRAAITIMAADPAQLQHRNAYNITAMSFTPAELAAAIRKHIGDFKISYEVDPIRQAIADSWPDQLDDSAARSQWDWAPSYDLERMTEDMLTRLGKKLRAQVSKAQGDEDGSG
ncbi:MAG: L-threonine 3-dehydrogenase [Desulfobulbaceae bacterium]|nr:L-threonine 3-dehydrogenase [Desulfobulbaceae bacterium]